MLVNLYSLNELRLVKTDEQFRGDRSLQSDTYHGNVKSIYNASIESTQLPINKSNIKKNEFIKSLSHFFNTYTKFIYKLIKFWT